MTLCEILFIAYVAICIAHFGFHLSLYHSVKMIEMRMKSAKSRRDPVYLYHVFHLKLTLLWPVSLAFQLRDMFKIRNEK